ncbi:hypothetical protein IAT38_000307 [Cryptococcus sp. DSM 104549]
MPPQASHHSRSELGARLHALPKERDSIKVLVVTWNMGDALPKGDLSVLLGHVPPYEHQSPSSSGVPALPTENAHPYHIVVVAGQECPTPSGAPRGLGGGLMKGVTLRHKKEGKDKDKEKKEKGKEDKDEKERSREEISEGHDKEREDGAASKSPDVGPEEDERELEARRASSPMTPHTPFLHRHPHQVVPRGWSQMLDDYLCGLNARSDVFLPPSLSSGNQTPRESPSITSAPFTAFPSPQPAIFRSSSTPGTPSTPIPIVPKSAGLTTPQHSHLRPSPSPLALSRSSFDSSSSSDNEADNTFAVMSSDDNHTPAPRTAAVLPQTSHPPEAKIRPEITIPTDEPVKATVGNGSYVHVAKERLLGMYLSVYVYKGCEHLVQGTDKDFVTAGLAGGRVGNKGGIGISLKLADHRFLFVNSHLAAHTDRKSARLANIAKIKAELRLDCFLPKDDPRAMEPDITDRFDTVFWCGDLNFRLEVSRLHAEWCIEHKQYADLLKWDQLKMAMEDPQTNPFPGFEEGPIDFPCTFKYDVWKSVRASNRILRRTLKRRKSSASATSVDPGSSTSHQTHQKSLSHVPEGDAIEEMDDDAGGPDCDVGSGEGGHAGGHHRPSLRSRADQCDRDQSDDDCPRRQSFESSRYTSGAASGAGTDLDDDSDDMSVAGRSSRRHSLVSNQHQRVSALETALKEKTRHLLGLVKMDGILATSPVKRGGVGRKVSRKRGRSGSRREREREQELEREGSRREADSRRTSMSSFVSTRAGDNDNSEDNRRVSSSSNRSHRWSAGPSSYEDAGHLAPPRVPPKLDNSPAQGQGAGLGTGTGTGSFSPPKQDRPPPFTRRLSVMKRTPSSKSVRDALGMDDEDDDDSLEMDVDRRRVYDTSKKQRVPSWCDRVLWKARIEPDPEPELEVIEERPSLDRGDVGHRLSAFFNIRGHLRPIRRTPSLDPGKGTRTPPRHPLAQETDRDDIIAGDAGDLLVASPPDSPDLRLGRDEPAGDGLIPAPKRASPLRSPQKDKRGYFFPMSQSVPAPAPMTPRHSPTKGSGLSTPPGVSQSTPEPARRRITFDATDSDTPVANGAKPAPTAAASPTAHVDRIKMTFTGRPRSNSDNTVEKKVSEKVGKKGRASDGMTPVAAAVATPTRPRASSGSPTPSPSLRPVNSAAGSASTTATLTNLNLAPGAHPPHPHPFHSKSYALPHAQPEFTPITHALTAGNPLPPNLTPSSSVRKEREAESGKLKRWLHEFDDWLHGNREAAGSGEGEVGGEGVEVAPPRRRKGEVVCLHYGTIDDTGMRQLEGRSDHRPAIFSAAVYI